MQMQNNMGLWLFVVMLLVGGGGRGCVLAVGEGREMIGKHSKNGVFVLGESPMESVIEGSEDKSSLTSEKTTFLVGSLVKANSIAVDTLQQLGKEASFKEESGKKKHTSLKEENGNEVIGLIEKKKLSKGAYLNEESDIKGLSRSKTYALLEKKKNLSEKLSKEAPFNEKPRRNGAVQKERATYKMSVYAGEGQFLTVLQIGSPPVSFTAIVDTGSDLVWRQCKPCLQCYPQSANTFPIFNPALSSTYHKASCSDPLCTEAQSYGGTCNRTCKYNSPYDDPPAYTRGDLAFDTLSISDVSGHPKQVAHFAFGCSHESRGPYNFAGAGGIVGFGQGKLALPAQLGIKKFSYCLPRIAMWSISSLDTNLRSRTEQRAWIRPKRLPQSSPSLSTQQPEHWSAPPKSPSPSPSSPPLGSPLILGEEATLGDGPNIQSTGILVNNDDPGYNVELQGISVAGRPINITRSAFCRGGTIIDSGTTFTTLAPQAFRALYAAFTALIPQKPTHAASPRNLSLCYSSLPWPLPTLSFHFRGAQIHLPSNNYFIFIDNLFCLAILKSHDSRCVYGNAQQQEFHILYDLHNRHISFKPTSCSAQQR